MHGVAGALEEAGFGVITVKGSRDALAKTYDSHPDLIVLAECLPLIKGDLPFVCIRRASDVPVIVLGDDNVEWAGIHFLESGVDVYMTHPTNLRELLAWVRSLLRRTQANPAELAGE